MTVDPVGPGYRADPPSMRSDAKAWSAAAQTLSEAASAADGLTVDPHAFSYLANWTTGVDQVYAQLQQKLAGLLHQGSQSFTDIAAALDASAATYEEAERAAAAGVSRSGQGLPPGSGTTTPGAGTGTGTTGGGQHSGG